MKHMRKRIVLYISILITLLALPSIVLALTIIGPNMSNYNHREAYPDKKNDRSEQAPKKNDSVEKKQSGENNSDRPNSDSKDFDNSVVFPQ